jgi:phospholipase/carboxylesterase
MSNGIDIQLLTFKGCTFRYRAAARTPSRTFLLFHGWTGDENSMGVFAGILPEDCIVLSPRAPHSTPEGGYSWREIGPGTWGIPSFNDLKPAAASMLKLMDEWSTSIGVETNQFNLIGFSQGAALSYVFAALFPERIMSVSALSGFIPSGTETFLTEGALEGKPVFIAHGVQDELVPVEQAREAGKLLDKWGARVFYCETDGGHKVSKACLKGMVNFLESDTIKKDSNKEKK